jgi:hypothetical protein
MTAFLANMVRDDRKHPDPYTHKDFMIDWEEVWRAVAGPEEEPELSAEELEQTNQNLYSKVLAANILFGGVPSDDPSNVRRPTEG